MELSNSDSMTEETPTRKVEEVSIASSAPKRSTYPADTVISGIEITGNSSAGSSMSRHTVYQVRSVFAVEGETDTHEVVRRYTNFSWLYKQVSVIPGLFLPPFPPKDSVNQFQESTILTRQRMFCALLSYLAELNLAVVRGVLVPFLTLSQEEFELHARENRPIGELLPAKPSSWLGYFYSGVPSIDVTRLRAVLENLPVSKTPVDTEALLVQAENADKAASSFQTFAKLVEDCADRTEEAADGFAGLQESAGEVENAEYIGSLADSEGQAEVKAAFRKLARVCASASSLMAATGKENQELYFELQSYGTEFQELRRLRDQYAKYELDVANADILVAEYKGKLVSETNLGKKKKLENLVSGLAEFKKLTQKAMQVFGVFFVQGFAKFRVAKAKRIQVLVENYLQGQLKALADAMTGLEEVAN